MPYSSIIYTRKDRIAHITLNRPEAGNIINQEMAQELGEVCSSLNQDDDIYVVVVTGAGDRAFCLGNELEESIRAGNAVEAALTRLKEQAANYGAAAAIAGIDRPVIAAINGDALGQGLELALACDIRLASLEAKLGFPEVAFGLMPLDGGTQRLPRLIGQSKAAELLFTAETISAQEALEIGLLSRVLAPEKLLAEAETLAQNIASKAPIALRYIKEAVNKGLDLTLEQGLRLEADLYFLLHTTADRTEGIRAFLEKRAARFKRE